MKKYYIIITLLLTGLLLVACNEKTKNNRDLTKEMSGFDCSTGFTQITTPSIDSIIKPSSDLNLRATLLKSSKKYGYEQSAYNLSDNCFSRKESNCPVSDQLYFNHGGDSRNLHLYGYFIVLDKSSSAKFDEINLDTLNELNLKTNDGTDISRDTIFGNPSTDRKMALGESSISSEYQNDSVVLALVDDTWSNKKYQLFKLKIEKVTDGDEVAFSYQRIAEAPTTDLKNFYCSKQLEIKKINASKSDGEAIVYSSTYAGYPASTFGFDYGVNGLDGRFVKSERVMSFAFADGKKCLGSDTKLCVNPYVGWVVGYWGGVIDIADTSLKDVNRSMWPDLQSIDPASASTMLKANRTYLISQFTDSNYTFGAIRINEIDPNGRWVKFNWKRVAIETPFRFMKYTNLAIPAADMSGTVTLGAKWWEETHLDIALAKRNNEGALGTEWVYFDVINSRLAVDNRYFPSHSGIAEITQSFNAVESVPSTIAENPRQSFMPNAPIRLGAVYLVSVEKFWFKASLALQVVDFVPGKFVKLKYKRLYNGQTFPGHWNKYR